MSMTFSYGAVLNLMIIISVVILSAELGGIAANLASPQSQSDQIQMTCTSSSNMTAMYGSEMAPQSDQIQMTCTSWTVVPEQQLQLPWIAWGQEAAAPNISYYFGDHARSWEYGWDTGDEFVYEFCRHDRISGADECDVLSLEILGRGQMHSGEVWMVQARTADTAEILLADDAFNMHPFGHGPIPGMIADTVLWPYTDAGMRHILGRPAIGDEIPSRTSAGSTMIIHDVAMTPGREDSTQYTIVVSGEIDSARLLVHSDVPLPVQGTVESPFLSHTYDGAEFRMTSYNGMDPGGSIGEFIRVDVSSRDDPDEVIGAVLDEMTDRDGTGLPQEGDPGLEEAEEGDAASDMPDRDDGGTAEPPTDDVQEQEVDAASLADGTDQESHQIPDAITAAPDTIDTQAPDPGPAQAPSEPADTQPPDPAQSQAVRQITPPPSQSQEEPPAPQREDVRPDPTAPSWEQQITDAMGQAVRSIQDAIAGLLNP